MGLATMADNKQPVDFDDYATDYEKLVSEQLKGFSADRGYFSNSKINIIQPHIKQLPSVILDFGCGIGLNLPFLQATFPYSCLLGTDLSDESLAVAKQRNPDVQLIPNAELSQWQGKVDLIFISGVFHHVPPVQRQDVIKQLAALLSADGQLFVFEHNPYNPVTRHMVNTCPFDEDAVLLTRREMAGLLSKHRELAVRATQYFLFFPYALRGLQALERYMGFIPLGGQYMVCAERE